MVSVTAYSPSSVRRRGRHGHLDKNKGNNATSYTHKTVRWMDRCAYKLFVELFISSCQSWYCPSGPLVQALKSTASQDVSSFHFPGHNRGKATPPSLSELIGPRTFLHDLPKLPELDDLFSLKVISSLVLSGTMPKYIVPEYNSGWNIAGGITPFQVDKAGMELEEDGKKPIGQDLHQVDSKGGLFTEKRRVCIENSLGEICGELICPYPPGIPVLIPGEIVTQDSLSYLINVRDNGMAISGAADGELKSIMLSSSERRPESDIIDCDLKHQVSIK
ncbi:hypothetical protein ABZP36_017967 [Zizania latifolia]